MIDGSVTMAWDGAPSGVYQVQYTDGMLVWQDSPTGQYVAPAVGGPMQWTDAGPPATAVHPDAVSRRYYRVVRRL